MGVGSGVSSLPFRLATGVVIIQNLPLYIVIEKSQMTTKRQKDTRVVFPLKRLMIMQYLTVPPWVLDSAYNSPEISNLLSQFLSQPSSLVSFVIANQPEIYPKNSSLSILSQQWSFVNPNENYS